MFRLIENLVDPDTRIVRRDDVSVRISPKAMQVLQTLRQADGAVLSRQDLLARVWPDVTVGEEVLTHAIAEIRKALGDTPRNARIVETVHKAGYRLLVTAETVSKPAPAPAAPDKAVVPAMVSQIALGETAASRSPEGADLPSAGPLNLPLPKRPSVAILPFTPVLGHDAAPDLADGLSRDVAVGLARSRWLFVSARASAVALTARALDAVAIGQCLGVRYVLSGALAYDGSRLRLTVMLTDAVQQCEVWAERFDRPVGHLFDVMTEVGDLVTAAVEAEIEIKERQRALLSPVTSLDAWSAYHRAAHHLFRFSPTALEPASVLLDRAFALDPESARTLSALSLLHWQRAFFNVGSDRDDDLKCAYDFAHRSLAMDPRDPQGHWALGRAHNLAGEFDLGVDRLRESVRLNPNFAQGHYSLAYGLLFADGYEEGIDRVDRARRLSPYDPMNFGFLSLRAQMLCLTGRRDEAAEWSDRAVREANAHYQIFAVAAWCNELAGRRDKALEHVAAIRAEQPDFERADYFRAFRFPDRERALIDGALQRLGL